MVCRMIQVPRLAEDAGFVGFVNARLVGMQFDVVADAAAERTCSVMDDVETHSDSFWEIEVRSMYSSRSA